MTDSGFGYVEIVEDKVKVVTGPDQNHPTIKYFENDEIVKAVKTRARLKKFLNEDFGLGEFWQVYTRGALRLKILEILDEKDG